MLPAFADAPRWTRMMRASIEMAVSRFSSDRMVEEYFARLLREPAGHGVVAAELAAVTASARRRGSSSPM